MAASSRLLETDATGTPDARLGDGPGVCATGRAFIQALQRATEARIHLMGHSFGCVVVSSILGGGSFARPIDSVFLAQGALSLWSYASSIPFPATGSGYFHKVIAEGRIRGPLVTTQSRFDTAVGVQYPKASYVSGEVAFDSEELPKYGAIGTLACKACRPKSEPIARCCPQAASMNSSRGEFTTWRPAVSSKKGAAAREHITTSTGPK